MEETRLPKDAMRYAPIPAIDFLRRKFNVMAEDFGRIPDIFGIAEYIAYEVSLNEWYDICSFIRNYRTSPMTKFNHFELKFKDDEKYGRVFSHVVWNDLMVDWPDFQREMYGSDFKGIPCGSEGEYTIPTSEYEPFMKYQDVVTRLFAEFMASFGITIECASSPITERIDDDTNKDGWALNRLTWACLSSYGLYTYGVFTWDLCLAAIKELYFIFIYGIGAFAIEYCN